MLKVFQLIISCSPILLIGQEVLLLDQAINVALDQNFSIAVAKINQRVAEIAVYRSNAGFGPTIDLNANANGTLNNVNQNYIDGREVRRFGRSIAPNANVALDWILYDGGGMQATLERLQEVSAASTVETQLQMQEIVVQVMEAYYEVVRQKDRETFLNTIIKYYEDRLRITEERWRVGRGSKLDFLQSKTDLNAQLSERSIAANQLRNAKVNLNGLLNRDLHQDFEVVQVETVAKQYDLDELRELAKNQNRDLILLQRLRNINLLAEKEIEAGKRPTLGLRSTLGYAYLNTNAGFLLSNQNASFSAGLSARWNLFDGKHLQNQIAIAQLETQRTEKQYDLVFQQIISDLTSAYNQFVTDQELLSFERDNQALAEENLSISVEKFKLGDSSILEVNEAQRTYDTAISRLVNAQHNARLSELELLRLSGSLVR